MKRLLLIAISALTASVCAYAGHLSEKELQFREYFPYKYEARIGWGGSPFGDMMTHGNGLFWRMSDVDYWDRDGYIPSLDNMYGTEGHAEYMTGVISAEFNFNLRHQRNYVTVTDISRGCSRQTMAGFIHHQIQCVRHIHY